MHPIVATILLLGTAAGDDDLARADARITAEDRQHWAFRPVSRPPVPEVKDAAWCRNEIDRFVLAGLEAKGWTPSPSPPPLALLRRVHFDLSGLPPTIEEQDAFLRDPSPEALDRVIVDLLARPSYGERWGRHWLDLVRFAESNGFERDAAKPQAWRYRDWVIRSLNDDKPYDRFLVEQIAGDELPDANAETLIATGFARLGPWDDEPADPAQDRFDQLDDIVATTGEVALGLTVGCARCHDHKFEPISQVDYYRMLAVFDPLQRPRVDRNERDLPAGTPGEVAALARVDRRIKDLSGARDAIAKRLAADLTRAKASPSVAAVRDVLGDFGDLASHGGRSLFWSLRRPRLVRGYFLTESSPVPPQTHLLLRGRATSPGPVVAPGVPAVLVATQPTFLPPDERTTRRRLTLARWLARPDHPLTARVIVNRAWQFHMGEGLVRTPSDFGIGGDPPTHPELLDWLADWFVHEGHWSLKELHKLILASRTARMGKSLREDYAAEDPDDRLLWRLPYRRLEVEAIRDAMLSASGRLNPSMYGPSMFPEVPAGAVEGNSDPATAWKPSSEREASRRTIYAFVKRSMIVPMIEVLDFCDTTRSTARRVNTSTAPQALALFNGDFVNRQAHHLADRLVAECGDDPHAQIDRAYRLALGRPARSEEIATLAAYLDREAGAIGGAAPRREALARLGRIVFNLNEFAYPD